MTIFFIYCISLIFTFFLFYPCFVVAGQFDEDMEKYFENLNVR